MFMAFGLISNPEGLIEINYAHEIKNFKDTRISIPPMKAANIMAVLSFSFRGRMT